MKTSKQIIDKAGLILTEIKKANSILLHCHPSPDPDSVGSALAMKFALEQLGKRATIIKGDSEIPRSFAHFPGASEIIQKNFFQIDLKDFDLFIVLDSAALRMISYKGKVEFPLGLKVIVIDHHQTNDISASINLVDPSYPATAELLTDLFKQWDIKTTPEIASNLFIGMYTDTGGFKYPGITARTYEFATDLVRYIPNVSELISKEENSNTPAFMKFEAKALDSIEVYYDGLFAISMVSNSFLKEKEISPSDVVTSEVSSFMLTVPSWNITCCAVEIAPNLTKMSFRSRDTDKFDVAKLASSLGGGGHKAASGLMLEKSPGEAKELVVTKVKELYNL
jgi:bifunctional oligoribonuclease and PAP phosphatase NrnA